MTHVTTLIFISFCADHARIHTTHLIMWDNIILTNKKIIGQYNTIMIEKLMACEMSNKSLIYRSELLVYPTIKILLFLVLIFVKLVF